MRLAAPKALSAAATLIGLLTVTPALAHGPGGGWQYQMGPGMMGYGQACPGGQGMMGCIPGGGGQWGYGMMGPGMMGSGMMGYGMGPGMMGPGMMGPGMMGPGMMGYGWGPGAYQSGREISADDARSYLEKQLEWQGNKRLKVGEVKQSDENTIVADIVTQDDSLVERFAIDRRTGQMRRVE